MEGDTPLHVKEWTTDLLHPTIQYVAVNHAKDVTHSQLNEKTTFQRMDFLVAFSYSIQSVPKGLTTHAVTFMVKKAMEFYPGRLCLQIW